ncbi:GMC family oxidoreductase [Alphaproteobacteria bacterium]|nr:GMC family oxidoreductase [Alphaproteobacteria bacterium]
MMEFDVVVIGGGAAGAAVTWKLAKAGLKVACLERGPWMKPEAYPSTKPDWETIKTKSFSPVPARRQSNYDYPIDDKDSPISVCNFNAVGGSTILYSGHFPRFRKRDFELRTKDGVGEDWPISYNDLQPYYDVNENEMGVAGLVGDPAYPEIEKLLPPVPIGKSGRVLAEAFNKLNWHWWPSYSAISTRQFNGRNACINLGPCNTGCPQQAKSSADVTYMSRAKNLQAHVITKAAVSRVVMRGRVAVGVEYFDASGVKNTVMAKKIVLAASAVGTPRILLNTKTSDFPNGLANGEDQVGRNLMIHPLGLVDGVFDDELDPDIGPQGCMIYSLQHYRDPEAGHKLGYMMQALRGDGPLQAARFAWLKKRLNFGESLMPDFDAVYRRKLSISVVCEDLAEPENRILLDSDTSDSYGIAGVKVVYKLHDNTRASMLSGMKRARQVMIAAGATKTYVFGPVRETGWHTMGTCRMGSNPKTSVVNKFGETHGVSNLYIADSSVFTSGSCVNPANTVQAVALYVADHIIQQLKVA